MAASGLPMRSLASGGLELRRLPLMVRLAIDLPTLTTSGDSESGPTAPTMTRERDLQRASNGKEFEANLEARRRQAELTALMCRVSWN